MVFLAGTREQFFNCDWPGFPGWRTLQGNDRSQDKGLGHECKQRQQQQKQWVELGPNVSPQFTCQTTALGGPYEEIMKLWAALSWDGGFRKGSGLCSPSEASAAPQEGAQQEQAACTLAFPVYAAIQTSVHHKWTHLRDLLQQHKN